MSLVHRTEQRIALIVARPVYAFVVLASKVLPRSTLLGLGRICARTVFTLFRGVRANLLSNAAHILGPDSTPGERRRLAHETLANFSRFLLEWVAPSCAPRGEQIFETAEGKEHFQSVLEKGKGVIALTLHMGNYELPARELAALTRCVAIAFHRERIGFLEMIRSRHRRAMNLDEIVIDQSRYFAIDALRRLEEGGIVLLAGDQVRPPDGVKLPFLHGEAFFSRWPARLAQTSGAPIVPAFCVHTTDEDGDDRYRLEIAAPITPRQDEAPEDLMRRVVAVLEQHLSRHAGQWLMVHRFWSEPA